MKAVRMDLTRKFMRLYKGFRHQKYGEPLEQKKAVKFHEETNFIPHDQYENVEYPPEIKEQDDIMKE